MVAKLRPMGIAYKGDQKSQHEEHKWMIQTLWYDLHAQIVGV